MVILITLNSSNYHYDFLDITTFEYSEILIDSYSDQNRKFLLISCVVDFFGSIICSTIVYYIFDQIAKCKSPNNNDNKNEREKDKNNE